MAIRLVFDGDTELGWIRVYRSSMLAVLSKSGCSSPKWKRNPTETGVWNLSRGHHLATISL